MKRNPLQMVATSLLKSISNPPPTPPKSVARLPFTVPAALPGGGRRPLKMLLAATGLSSKST